MLEAYVRPWLLSQLQQYVHNVAPEDLNLSLWGGDLLLKNLQLKVRTANFATSTRETYGGKKFQAAE